ncbi:hypothetical protein [Bradyrhizobium sp. USDA 10063]
MRNTGGDRGFTHPNFGNQARVEVWGNEVRLILVAGTNAKANDLAEYLVAQLQAGFLNLTLMGKPTLIIEDEP